MENKDKNPQHKQSKYRAPKSNSTPKDTINDQSEIQQSTAQAEIPSEIKKKKWETANTIAIIAVLVNAAMLWATYKLFVEAHNSTKVAQETLDSTKAYTKRGDSIRKLERSETKEAEQKRDTLDSVKRKKDNDIFNVQKDFYAKQKQGIDSQISAIKQTQKQFEISHSPYIDVIGFGFNPADSLEIDIQNEGTQVAYLTEMGYAIKAERSNAAIFKSFKTNQDWRNWLSIPKKNISNIQSILAPAPAKFQNFKSWKSVSDTDMSLVRSRKKNLYIRVVVYYYNTATNKYVEYDVAQGWNPVDNLYSTVYFSYRVLKKYP